MNKNIFKSNIKIKHADWPHIILLTGLFLVFSAVGYFLFDGILLLIYSALAAMFFIILSVVHHYRLFRSDLEYNQYKIQALNEITSLLNLRLPLPPMTGWAATPELAVTVLKTIITNKPKHVIELGSGVSTIVSAYAIEKYSPKSSVISFDHDPEYAEKTRNELQIHQLQSIARVLHAPLADISLKGKKWRWYDIDKSILGSKNIDLLIIDGPPVKTQKYARYPALPFFFNYLSENGIIILHDTDRETESETLNRWTEELEGIQLMKNVYSEKGVTLLCKRP